MPSPSVSHAVSPGWRSPLALDAGGRVLRGSPGSLCDAIRRGADLRIRTDFRYNEHLDPASKDDQRVEEISDFRTTYLVDDRWSAGIMTLRYPVAEPHRFGPRPSLSFFLYNQNGYQAIARPYLDGQVSQGVPGASQAKAPPDMAKYHVFDAWDGETNAPCSNFRYDFETFEYLVREDWAEVLAHDGDGEVISGSLDDLIDAFRSGREIKVGIRDICRDLAEAQGLSHEMFAPCGSGYFCTKDRLFFTLTQPTVRVRPAIPMRYASRAWDFGWLLVHTDGRIDGQLCDPYSLAFGERSWRCAVRWFVR